MSSTTTSPTLRPAKPRAHTALALAGVACVAVAQALPAVSYAATGGPAYELRLVQTAPALVIVGLFTLLIAFGTNLLSGFRSLSPGATRAAAIVTAMVGIWGFLQAWDEWSLVHERMRAVAGAESLSVLPGIAFLPLFAGVALMWIALPRAPKPG
jgi:hypothetical protein